MLKRDGAVEPFNYFRPFWFPSGGPFGQVSRKYGFIAPSEDAGKCPNEWQTLDIALIGRRIAVVVNDKR